MAKGKPTYYEILGIPSDAKHTDVGRAYNRLKADLHRDNIAPDPRRAAILQEAYDTLFDLDRRAAYDKSLVAPKVRKGAKNTVYAILGLALIAAGGYAAYLYTLPAKAPPTSGRNPQDIVYAASLAVGRVESLDMAGQATPLGLAFLIDEDVMLTTCGGIKAGSVLMVNIPPRKIPAQVMTSDEERGLCKLSAKGVGSKPLQMSKTMPRIGEKVYATKVNSVGQVALAEGKVKQVHPEPSGRRIEASIAIAPGGGGGPLLDTEGRVVGVTLVSQPDAVVRHVEIPASWIVAPPVRGEGARVAPPTPAASDEPSPAPSEGRPRPKSLENIPPERIEKLEKAFRPPPKVEDDYAK